MTDTDIRLIALDELDVVLNNAESQISRRIFGRNNDRAKLAKAIILTIQENVRRRIGELNIERQRQAET